MPKRPSFQFYPGDWLRDTSLRSCSVSARGLWIEMICLMHEGAPYGYLKVNHKVILPVNLARMVGLTLPEVEGWLKELEEAGVFSRDEEGVIYSRRMVRDEEIRASRAAGGSKGGNPRLKDNLEVNPKVGGKVNLLANLSPTPASASASALEERPPNPQTGEVCVIAPSDFMEAWNALGKPFPRIEGMTGKRLKSFQARCRDSFWREHWRKALAEIPLRPFLRGEGKGGWIADVEFFLKPDSVRKIIEGSYSSGGNGKPVAKSGEEQAKEVQRRLDEQSKAWGYENDAE